jgi:hypothetical protein
MVRYGGIAYWAEQFALPTSNDVLLWRMPEAKRD